MRLSSLILAGFAATLLVSGFQLAWQLPLLQHWCWIDGTKMEVGHSPLQSSKQEPFELVYSLSSGKVLQRPSSLAVFEFETADERIRVVRLPARQGSMKSDAWASYEMIVTNVGGTNQTKVFDFPCRPLPIDEETVAGFMVDSGVAELNWMDLRNGQLEKLPWPATYSQSSSLIPIGSRAVVLNASRQATGGSLPEEEIAEYLQWDASNLPSRIWTKQLHSHKAISEFGNKVYLIESGGLELQCYDSISESWEQPIALPDVVAEALSKNSQADVYLTENLLQFTDTNLQTRFWRLPSLQSAAASDRTSFVPIKKYPNLALHLDTDTMDQAFSVYDFDQGCDLWTYQAGALLTGFSQSRDRDFLLVANPKFGLTIDKLDTQTGKLLQRHRPYAWACWALPLTIAGGYIWALFAIRLWGAQPWGRWLLIAGMSCAFLGILLVSLARWGLFERPVFAHNYMQGFFIAAHALGLAWIVWGQGRLVIRCLPYVGIVGLVIILARLMLEPQWLKQEAVVTTLLTASMALPVFLVLRWFGVGRRKVMLGSHAAWKLPIRDLFVACTGAAILVALSQPLLAEIRWPQGIPREAKLGAIAELVMLLGMSLILLAVFYPNLRVLSGALSWSMHLLIVAVAMEACYALIIGQPLLIAREDFRMLLFRGTATSLVAFSLIARLVFDRGSDSRSTLSTR